MYTYHPHNLCSLLSVISYVYTSHTYTIYVHILISHMLSIIHIHISYMHHMHIPFINALHTYVTRFFNRIISYAFIYACHSLSYITCDSPFIYASHAYSLLYSFAYVTISYMSIKWITGQDWYIENIVDGYFENTADRYFENITLRYFESTADRYVEYLSARYCARTRIL